MTHTINIDPGLDHVVIMVHGDLDEAAACYESMGFHLTPRGHHSLGSSNNLAIFQNNYLELLGFEEGKHLSRPELMETPRGLSAVVWRCPDPDLVTQQIRGAGIDCEDPIHFLRPVDTNDGTFDAAFAIVHLPKIGFAEGRSFFCHHKTPELVWRSEWQGHPNKALDLSEFVFAGGEPIEALSMFDRIFGPGLPYAIDGGFAMNAAEAKLVALTAEAAKTRFGSSVSVPDSGAARMIALGVKTASLEAVRLALNVGNVTYEDLGTRLRVGEDAAFGLAIEFHE